MGSGRFGIEGLFKSCTRVGSGCDKVASRVLCAAVFRNCCQNIGVPRKVGSMRFRLINYGIGTCLFN